jgi:hypothetical protein
MLGGIMFSSSRFDNNKNQSELETLTWIVMTIITVSLIYYATVFTLEIIAQTCPNRCCFNLSLHLGDGYVERKKRKRAKRRTLLNGGMEMSRMSGLKMSNPINSGVLSNGTCFFPHSTNFNFFNPFLSIPFSPSLQLQRKHHLLLRWILIMVVDFIKKK